MCEECGHRASSRNGLQMHIKAKHRCAQVVFPQAGAWAWKTDSAEAGVGLEPLWWRHPRDKRVCRAEGWGESLRVLRLPGWGWCAFPCRHRPSPPSAQLVSAGPWSPASGGCASGVWAE